MIDKIVPSLDQAVADIADGATVMIGGFGTAGMPSALIDALIRQVAERIRAAGAGIGAFFTRTAYGTPLAEGKETREIDGQHYVLEYPIHADYALIRADRADRWGNLVYRKTARNFGPIMASAAKCTIVEVREVVPLGALDPEAIVTPGIFVKRVVQVRDASVLAAPGAAA